MSKRRTRNPGPLMVGRTIVDADLVWMHEDDEGYGGHWCIGSISLDNGTCIVFSVHETGGDYAVEPVPQKL